MEEKKKWWQSKTIIMGVIAAIIGGLQAYETGGSPTAIALAVFGALFVALRTVTSKKLTK